MCDPARTPPFCTDCLPLPPGMLSPGEAHPLQGRVRVTLDGTDVTDDCYTVARDLKSAVLYRTRPAYDRPRGREFINPPGHLGAEAAVIQGAVTVTPAEHISEHRLPAVRALIREALK